MVISDTVRNFVEVLNAYSHATLHERDNLALLLQVAGDSNNKTAVGELAFHGKYLWRLYQTIQKEARESDTYEKLQAEFTRSVEEFQAMIRKLLPSAPQDVSEMFQRHFLSLSPASLQHLLLLAGDLYHLKNWELEFEEQNSDR